MKALQPNSTENMKHRNFNNFYRLPYNPKLKERARSLRKARNLSETLLWNKLKNGQFKGYDFDRQKIIGNFIVDFFCTNCNVVIEIDGSSYIGKEDDDRRRDKYLEILGLVVIHIDDLHVKKNIEQVMEYLLNHPAFSDSNA